MLLKRNHSQLISHLSWFSIKTKGLIIKHPKHQSLDPCYIITSPIVKVLVKH